ncbi:MAG: tetratricopeptide repeat protein [Candidatus Kapaibacterium sp.]
MPDSDTDSIFAPPESTSVYEYIDRLNDDAALYYQTMQTDKLSDVAGQALELSLHHSYPKGQAYALMAKSWLLSGDAKYDESLVYLNNSLEIFLDLADAVGISRAMKGIGNIYYYLGTISKALDEFLGGYITLLLAGEEEQALALLNNICNCYDMLADYRSALDYADKYLTLARRLDDKRHIATALNIHGILCCNFDNYPAALEHYLGALSITSELNDPDIERWLVCNIGLVYMQLGNYSSGLHYFMQGLVLSEKIANLRHQGFCCYNISNAFLEMGNYSLALNYGLQSLALNEQISYTIGQGNSLENLARIFYKLRDLPTAIDYARKSLALHESTGFKRGKINMLALLSKISEDLGEIPEAYRLSLLVLELAQDLGNTTYAEALSSLARITKTMGNTTESAGYLKQHKTLIKLIQRDEKNAQTAKRLAESELEKTKKQAQKLTATAVTASPSLANGLLSTPAALGNQGFILAPNTHAEPIAAAPHTITVTTFGRFSVSIDGRELTAEDWQRKKARDIFKILLINHRQSVTIDELIDFLWPDSASKNLIPTLWNSVSYIRKALEPDIKPHTPSSYITIMDKAYMLDLGTDCTIDYLEFKALLAQSHKLHHQPAGVELMAQAIALYKGDFLKEDAYEEWASYERESLKEQYLETLISLGNYYLDAQNFPEAISAARKAIETDRVYEEGYELLFTALADNNQFSELAKAWKACQTAYKKELGALPPKFLEKLAHLS